MLAGIFLIDIKLMNYLGWIDEDKVNKESAYIHEKNILVCRIFVIYFNHLCVLLSLVKGPYIIICYKLGQQCTVK